MGGGTDGARIGWDGYSPQSEVQWMKSRLETDIGMGWEGRGWGGGILVPGRRWSVYELYLAGC